MIKIYARSRLTGRKPKKKVKGTSKEGKAMQRKAVQMYNQGESVSWGQLAEGIKQIREEQ